jgi:hypothetical protein
MQTKRALEIEQGPSRRTIGPWIAVFGLGVWLSAGPVAQIHAAESEAVPASVASLLDDHTIAIVGVDTTRIDLDSVATQIAAIPVLSERERGELARLKKNLANWLDVFRRAGGRDLWLVLNVSDDLSDVAVLVVPLPTGADRSELEALFVKSKLKRPEGQGYPLAVDAAIERDGGLILGSDAAIKRIQAHQGPPRAIPQPALAAVAGAEIRVFVLPTGDQRRVLGEFLRDPQAERKFIGQPPARVAPELRRDPTEIAHLALTDGLQWLAAGITTHENLAVKVVIGSKDATSAQALALWMRAVWQLVRHNVAGEKTPESAPLASLIDQLARLFAPQVEGNQLTIRVDARQVMASAAGALLGNAAVGVAKRSEATVVRNNLKQLALAMHNYHDVNKQFPPAAIRDAQGRPLLSWRVLLLPYLEQNELYKQFHLDEPWDSEHNKPLIAKMPNIFAPRNSDLRDQGKTTLVVPIGKQTVFGPEKGVAIQEITDGTSNTILIVDADQDRAVVWTKPDDLNVDGGDVRQILFGARKDGFYCAFADGSVQRIGPRCDATLLHALLTRNGGDIPQWPER